MATDPYAPPASEEEQFREVARLLGVALHRWHKLNRGMVAKVDPPLSEQAREDRKQSPATAAPKSRGRAV